MPAATGAIAATAIGGTPPYRYSKDGIAFQNSNEFQNLPAGSYTITVEDVNSCLATMAVTLTDPAAGPPLALAVVAMPSVIWPPDDKLHAVHLTATVTGGCAPVQVVLTSITRSCPPEHDRDKPDAAGADLGTADFDFQLRAREC